MEMGQFLVQIFFVKLVPVEIGAIFLTLKLDSGWGDCLGLTLNE